MRRQACTAMQFVGSAGEQDTGFHLYHSFADMWNTCAYVWIYMCVCVCVCVCMYMYTYTYIYVCYPRVCMYVLALIMQAMMLHIKSGFISSLPVLWRLWKHTYIHMYTNIFSVLLSDYGTAYQGCTWFGLCMFYGEVWKHAYIHTYIHTYMHTYMHTYKYIYAHTYMYFQSCRAVQHMRKECTWFCRQLSAHKPLPYLYNMHMYVCDVQCDVYVCVCVCMWRIHLLHHAHLYLCMYAFMCDVYVCMCVWICIVSLWCVCVCVYIYTYTYIYIYIHTHTRREKDK